VSICLLCMSECRQRSAINRGEDADACVNWNLIKSTKSSHEIISLTRRQVTHFFISRRMMKSEGDAQSQLLLVMADTWAGLQASLRS
jgi:hypothetical protein